MCQGREVSDSEQVKCLKCFKKIREFAKIKKKGEKVQEVAVLNQQRKFFRITKAFSTFFSILSNSLNFFKHF